jgi:hypothetical protein
MDEQQLKRKIMRIMKLPFMVRLLFSNMLIPAYQSEMAFLRFSFVQLMRRRNYNQLDRTPLIHHQGISPAFAGTSSAALPSRLGGRAFAPRCGVWFNTPHSSVLSALHLTPPKKQPVNSCFFHQ